MRLACILHCRLCIEAVQQWCDQHHDFNLTYAGDGHGVTVAELAVSRPDVVLIDLDLREEAFELANCIRRTWLATKLAFVGDDWTDLLLARALQAEAHGLLLKSEPTAAMFEHLWHIYQGQTQISDGLRKRLRFDSAMRTYSVVAGGPVTTLSNLQLEILRLLAYGDSLKMVASKLKLSRKSIDGHKYRLMRKLGVKDRVLLSRLAIREGLIQP